MLAVIVSVALGASFADIPKTISFQGRLSTEKGVPLDGLHDITVAIYPEPPTKPLFVEEHPGVAVSAGVFPALLQPYYSEHRILNFCKRLPLG